MRCFAKIDLDKIIENALPICNKIGKDKIIAVVKANAYGHGDIKVVECLLNYGISYFAVATYDEALRLNTKFPSANILILGEIDREYLKKIEGTNIIASISRFSDLEYMLENNISARVHIKCDTGMNRLGFSCSKIENLVKYIGKLNIEAIFTHLSSVDVDNEYTKKQIDLFLSSTKNLNIKKHMLNSAGIRKYIDKKEYVLDYVRLGIDLYKDVLSLYSKIVHIHDVKKGEKVGYDGTYVAENDILVATLAIGYADGLKRCLSNRLKFKYMDNEYMQIGNICMDLTMIKADEKLKLGDYLSIFTNNYELLNVAKLAGTISYEILTSISDRVERIYIKTSQ